MQKVGLPDQYNPNDTIAVLAWVGISRDFDGGLQLLQGGWGALYLSSSTFVYYVWRELYLENTEFISLVELGDEVHISVHMVDKSSGIARIYIWVPGKGINTVKDYILNETGRDIKYVHYIVETPFNITANEYARLPSFNTIRLGNISIVLSNGYAYYVTRGSSLINLGYCIKEILMQGNYVNANMSSTLILKSVFVKIR